MDRGAYWSPVHGVAKNWTRLSEHTHTHTHQGLIIVLLLFLRDLHLSVIAGGFLHMDSVYTCVRYTGGSYLPDLEDF